MRRSQLRRSTPEKIQAWRRRSKRLTVTQARRPSLIAFHDAVKAQAGGWCEANIDGVCVDGRHPGAHAHHRRLRSQGGSDDPSNGSWLCAVAHRWVHDHPVLAHARGLIVWRGDVDAG